MGAGPRRKTTSCRTQKESHLCYVTAGLGHPTLPSQFPHPRHPSLYPKLPLTPSRPPTPPTVSPACASTLGMGFELQVADSWFGSLPPCCFSALGERSVNLAFFVFSIIVGGLVVVLGEGWGHIPLSANHLHAASECPQTAFDRQLHVCACPSHLMSTFSCPSKSRRGQPIACN